MEVIILFVVVFIVLCLIVELISRAIRRKIGHIESKEKSPKESKTEYVKKGANYAKDKVNDTLNNEETGMFASVGDKLKKWAKANVVLGVIYGIVIAIVAVVIDDEFIFAGIGVGIVEILAAWAFSLILYAFGELVGNSKESKKIQQEILNELKNKNT